MISVKRATEILDTTHRENYKELSDGLEQINEAMKMGKQALGIICRSDCGQCKKFKEDMRKDDRNI